MWHAALAPAVLLLLQLSAIAVRVLLRPGFDCYQFRPCPMHIPLPLSVTMCMCPTELQPQYLQQRASLRLLLRIVKIFASSCRKLQKSEFSYVNFTQHARLKLV